MRRGPFVVMLTLLPALVACDSGAMDSAKESLSKKYTCPVVGARVRKDVTAVQAENRKKGDPPKEVAADPQRLAMWRAQQTENDRLENNATVVEAWGCNHSELYVCRYSSHNGGQTDPWSCSAYDYPPDIKKF